MSSAAVPTRARINIVRVVAIATTERVTVECSWREARKRLKREERDAPPPGP